MKTPFPAQLPRVHYAGTLIFDPVWAEKRHATPTCELIHVIRGRVEVVLGRQRLAAGPGDTLLIPAKATHRDDFDPSAGLEAFLLFFSWSAEGEYFRRVPPGLLPTLPAAVKQTVAARVTRLRREFAEAEAQASLGVRIAVLEVLLALLSGAAAMRAAAERPAVAEHGRRHWLMEQAKGYLEANYSRSVALEDVARHLRVSPYHLSHVFSAESDFSLFEFLTRLRMEKARELLLDGRRNVAEVAYAVGFGSAGYFSKVFLRHFGERPSDMLGRGALRTPQRNA